MKKWFVLMKKADFNTLAKKHNLSPMAIRLLRNRDILESDYETYLTGNMSVCHSPFLLKDMKLAVTLLKEKIKEQKKIRIIGDYDADGICSTYILQTGLLSLGAYVDAVIPHRMKDGYGLNQQLVEDAFAEGVDTIITCDNGISAVEQIKRAKELGMTVIITDHHEPFFKMEKQKEIEVLPDADAIVNCKQQECSYPFKKICGAFTAYKLIVALYGNEEVEPKLFQKLIQTVAIATVCDIMELQDENRSVVKEGLLQMRKNPLVGIKALCKANSITQENITSYHLGFVIGPNLNASGRLDTALRGLELLSVEDLEDAEREAETLKALNDERKLLTEQGVEEVIKIMERDNLTKDKVLVVYLPNCHESIAGIVASRIKENYYKPVLIVTDAEEGLKGSGRSIEGYNLHKALVECESLLTKFGGHKMAVGFSLTRENLMEFRNQLNQNCKLLDEDFIETLTIDMQLPFEYATLSLVHEIQLLEPFGMGNKKPIFAQKDVLMIGIQKIGKQQQFLKIKIMDEYGHKKELMLFGKTNLFLDFILHKYGSSELESLFVMQGKIRFNVAYEISSNWYQNKEQLQFKIVDYC